jgi:hypothetical protein
LALCFIALVVVVVVVVVGEAALEGWQVAEGLFLRRNGKK